MKLYIKIRKLLGKPTEATHQLPTHCIEISPTSENTFSVQDLKEQLELKLNVPVCQQLLIFEGQILQEEHLLVSDVGLRDGYTVNFAQVHPLQLSKTYGGRAVGGVGFCSSSTLVLSILL